MTDRGNASDTRNKAKPQNRNPHMYNLFLPEFFLSFLFFSSEQTDLRCEFTSTAQLSSLKQLRLYFFHLFLPRLSLEAIFSPSLSSLTNLQNFSTTSLIVSVVLSVLPQPSAR